MSDSAAAAHSVPHGHGGDDDRRDFLIKSTITVGVVGVGLAAWPFLDFMNPSKDVLALASTEVDLSPVEVGQSITVVWRGKPVFIRRRTQKEIDEAKNAPLDGMKDPEPDSERAKKPEWLIVVGICTHLGCIPLGQNSGDPRGDYDGWFCPCHGSMYDSSGRIRRGPAPRNLAVPPYQFTSDTQIKIG